MAIYIFGTLIAIVYFGNHILKWRENNNAPQVMRQARVASKKKSVYQFREQLDSQISI